MSNSHLFSNSHRLSVGVIAMWTALVTSGIASSAQPEDIQRVVGLVDSRIEQRWREDGITPADPASDAEFLRRVSLDVIGRIPSVMETRRYLADDSPNRREELIDRLLANPRYAVHFTHVWARVLLPEVETNPNARFLLPSFEAWLRTRLLENASYVEMVREILGVDVNEANLYQYDQVTPAAYYAAKETKPENLAAATSRMFLGVRIECAQCHDHPFDDWTRQDFWGYAAFFGGLQRLQPGRDGLFAQIREFFGQTRLRIPDTDEWVEPTYLGGAAMARRGAGQPRQALSAWMTSDDNPYFARMAVNRMWSHCFGQGLVEPIDDFSKRNPPSHPELLAELAEVFASESYDLKFLIRCLTLSRAYGLSSRQTHDSQSYPQRFARMAVKRMTADQVYDSLTEATGRHEPFTRRNPFVFGDAPDRSRFEELFTDENSGTTDRPTTILQSLALMNGDYVVRETDVEGSQMLTAVVEFPDFDTAERIDAIFLAALSRAPTARERETCVAYVESGGVRGDWKWAMSDVFWALLNSSEFVYNH